MSTTRLTTHAQLAGAAGRGRATAARSDERALSLAQMAVNGSGIRHKPQIKVLIAHRALGHAP